jgi:nucleoside-diphosphate-sugar epimerase
VRELLRHRHKVAVFHRGGRTAELRANVRELRVQHFTGDRRHLAASKEEFRRFEPEVVIDLILSSGAQAQDTMRVFRGWASRLVVISSMDVYRACAVLHGTDTGPLERVPVTEDSALRAEPQYPAHVFKAMRAVFGWIDDAYDKVAVERAVADDPELPATILRLPMIYGPGDRLHRLFPLLKRMDDGRSRILLPDDLAQWRGPRGYVENVAAAVALAATHQRAAGRVYNVAEKQSLTELEWAQQVAAQAGWTGEFLVLPRERAPQHLRMPGNLNQHWTASSERIRKELKYREPVAFDEGLRRTVEWERNHPPAHYNLQQFDYAAEDRAAEAASA